MAYVYYKRMYDSWLRKTLTCIDAVSVLGGRHIFTAIDQICAPSNPNTVKLYRVNGILTKVHIIVTSV